MKEVIHHGACKKGGMNEAVAKYLDLEVEQLEVCKLNGRSGHMQSR